MKTAEFSETIAASDLKQKDLMKMSIEGQGHFLTLAQGRVAKVVYIQKFKPDFLGKNCVYLN